MDVGGDLFVFFGVIVGIVDVVVLCVIVVDYEVGIVVEWV